MLKKLVPALLLVISPFTLADVAVVVNKANPSASLTANVVADIFLNKASSFPAGGSASPVDLKEGEATRDEFYDKVSGKSAAQMKAYWSRLIFTGKGKPPASVGSAAEVLQKVASDPSAIGYVDAGSVNDSVKVVLTLP